MRKMKYAVVLICLMLLSLVLCSTALAATTQQKKIVYVVLDDSTSMDSVARWTRANYATQVLAGLMNQGDELKVYYLERSIKYGPQSVDLSANGIQNSLQKISNMETYVATPFSGVQLAQKAINARTPEKDAQYWLVILTDGSYNEGYSAQEIRNKFQSFVADGVGMQHEKLRMIYLTIGNNAVRIDEGGHGSELAEKGIYCYHAQDGDGKQGIVPVMGEVADRISGRTRLDGASIVKVNSKTLQIKSDIPLFNFVVMTQGSKSSLTSVVCDNTTQLTISRSAPARANDSKQNVWLNANVQTVDNGSKHIPPGTYTLNFDSDVDVSKVTVLFEPALQVKMNYLPDPATVHVDQSFTAEAKIMEYGTSNVFSLAQLPKGSTLTLEVKNGKKTEKKSGNDPQVTLGSVENADIYVTGTLQIPGFREIVITERFKPIPPPPLSAQVVGNKTLNATVEQLKSKEKYMDFQVTLNGKTNISKQELQAQGLSVKTDLADYELECRDKGILRFYPKYTNGMKMGSYFVELYASDGRKLDAGTVVVSPSTYDIQAEKTPIKVKEAAFAANNQEFRFTLLVDGKPADVSKYPGMAVFSELTPGNPLVVSADKGKWAVEACYVSGMKPGSYPIMVSVNGQPVQQAAELILEASEYKIEAGKKEFTFRQSELAKVKAKDFSFKVTLREDGKAIAADQVQVEGWPAAWVQKTVDARKNTEMTVTLTGDLSVDPKDHVITLRYVNSSGQVTEEYVTVHVLPSDFTIELTPENKQLIFNDPQEFRDNAETFRFKIQVDGRDLTATELNAVTRLDTASVAGTSTTCNPDGSGYVVHPRVDASWQPGQNRIDYVIACIAGEGDPNEARKELRFTYHYIVYTVECFAGDGISMKTTDLIQNQQSMHFRILADNVQLGQDMVENNFRITIPSNFAKYVKMDAQVQPNGDIVVTPMHATSPGVLAAFRQVFIPEGNMQVTLSFKKASDTAMVELLHSPWYEEWWMHIAAFVTISYILLQVFKKRFYAGSAVEFAEATYNRENGKLVFTMQPIDTREKFYRLPLVGWAKMKLDNGHPIRATAPYGNKRSSFAVEMKMDEHIIYIDDVSAKQIPNRSKGTLGCSLPSDPEDWTRFDKEKRIKWVRLTPECGYRLVKLDDKYYVYRFVSGYDV
ncbi:MAG: hypothetical protein IJN44_07315 [Clostridia bacterium]|nr:hypothetical protein [Clostridia bacterium]